MDRKSRQGWDWLGSQSPEISPLTLSLQCLVSEPTQAFEASGAGRTWTRGKSNVLGVMLENAEVGTRSAEVPVLGCFCWCCCFCFLNAKLKSFLWSFFSMQTAFSPVCHWCFVHFLRCDLCKSVSRTPFVEQILGGKWFAWLWLIWRELLALDLS